MAKSLKYIGYYNQLLNRSKKRVILLANMNGNEIKDICCPYNFYVESIRNDDFIHRIDIKDVSSSLYNHMKKYNMNTVLCNPVFNANFEISQLYTNKANLKIQGFNKIDPMKGNISSAIDIAAYLLKNNPMTTELTIGNLDFYINVDQSLHAISRIIQDNYEKIN